MCMGRSRGRGAHVQSTGRQHRGRAGPLRQNGIPGMVGRLRTLRVPLCRWDLHLGALASESIPSPGELARAKALTFGYRKWP